MERQEPEIFCCSDETAKHTHIHTYLKSITALDFKVDTGFLSNGKSFFFFL